MTRNGNDIIAPTAAQAAMPAVTFPSLCSEAAFFLPLFSLL